MTGTEPGASALHQCKAYAYVKQLDFSLSENSRIETLQWKIYKHLTAEVISSEYPQIQASPPVVRTILLTQNTLLVHKTCMQLLT